ncbi:MAG: four helix bundle protein [Bacteroidetes bacterium]|nr:four helix bundle protein [Bacteroidota bacterium]
MNESFIKTKSFAFAIRIVRLYQNIIENKKEYVISKQLLRSGTAIGAMVREAQNAESQKDFIHKLGIAQKECDETIYWLDLLKETNYIADIEYENLNLEAKELLKMIRSAIITSKKKL